MSAPIEGKRILITGPTSQVALPLARALAPHNTLFGLARFGDPAAREGVERLGVTCLAADLARDDFAGVPEDLDYLLHFAVVKGRDFDEDLAANAEGLGRLMSRCRNVKAAFVCSTTGVYEDAGRHPHKETDPLGDNHRAMFPTYSISKIAAETVARFAARQWNIPTTIARLNVPYGDNGGWPAFHLEMMLAGQPIPVHADQPCLYNPLHEDDYVAMIPRMLEIADVPARVLNWGGSQAVSIEEWCAHLGELTGLEPSFAPTEHTIGSMTVDLSRMHELVGETRMDWRDGLRRMVATLHPELLAGDSDQAP